MTTEQIKAAQATLAAYYANSVGASVARSVAEGKCVTINANTGKRVKTAASYRDAARRVADAYARGEV
jgi:hypothetical protein